MVSDKIFSCYAYVKHVTPGAGPFCTRGIIIPPTNFELEDLTVLKRSPDLLNNVKIGQDQLRLIMKHILLYGGCSHFGQVT